MPLLIRYQRSHLSPFGLRIADHSRLGRRFGDLSRCIDLVPRYQHAARGIAGLPGILEAVRCALRHRFLQIGIIENDVRRLATEFLCNALDTGCGVLCNGNTRTCRTRERDHCDIGMAAQSGADRRPIAVDQIEYAGGDTGLVQDLGENHGVEWRDLARLQHHRAAGSQCRCHLDDNLVYRPVPGRDQRTRPDGFPDDTGRAMSLFKLEILERLQRCSDVLGSARGLRMLGQSPGSAHFLHDRRGHLVLPLHEYVEDGFQ